MSRVAEIAPVNGNDVSLELQLGIHWRSRQALRVFRMDRRLLEPVFTLPKASVFRRPIGVEVLIASAYFLPPGFIRRALLNSRAEVPSNRLKFRLTESSCIFSLRLRLYGSENEPKL